jgi:hypothetical protein
MTETGKHRISLGLLLLAVSFSLMMGNLINPEAEPPFPEIGTAFYLTGLLLAFSGNFLTWRGLGPGAWHPFLRAALILDGLACVYPVVDLANRVAPPLGNVLQYLPWTYLPSLPLHVGAMAAVVWALGEVCFFHRFYIRRSNLIVVGIVFVAAAICFFVTADEGKTNHTFVVVSLLGQLALLYPVLKIRGLLARIMVPA